MAHMPKWTSRLACALAAAVVAIPAAVGAAPWEFTPRVAAGQVWTDNIRLAPDGVEESEWITELRPGFTLATAGPRVRLDLDYDLQALWFNDFSELDDTYHQLDGNGNFVLLPESLFIDAFARYDQQNVDTSGRIAFDNLFDTDNRTDTFVYGASPYHVGRWGGWGESLVRYQYQGVRYSNTDPGAATVEDSESNAISASLGSPATARGTSWRVDGSYNRTEFDDSPEFEYARVALDIGAPVGLRTRLTGTVGQESDVEESSSQGGLDSSFWYAGFAWEPSELQSLEARVGQRFFGTAWELHWRRRGSRGELMLDYTEEPSTSAGVLGDSGIFVPGTPAGGVGSLNTRVFLQKRLSGSAAYEFVRSTITASVFSDRREYQDAVGGTEKNIGATLDYSWDAAPRTRVGLVTNWQRTEPTADRRDNYSEIAASLTRTMTRTLSAVFRVSHFQRYSDVDDDYQANVVSAFVQASF
jgi:hypothetical protein